jgi:hypothetical protein
MANVLKRQGKLDDVAVGRGRGGGRAGSLLAAIALAGRGGRGRGGGRAGSLLAAIAARDQAGGRAGRGGLVVC